VIAVLLALTGCSAWKIPENFSLPGSKPKFEVPSRMTDIWSYTVLNQPGQAGVRGFGGRLMFYNDLQETPIKVDGTLTVFAFDGQRDTVPRDTPLRKFVFLPEQLSKHHSKTKLGDSYSFWLPWDEVGGPEGQLSLITRFETRKGEVIVGAPSHQTLVGFKPEGEAPARSPNNSQSGTTTSPDGVRPASHQEPVGDQGPAKVTTTTITVPPNFVRRTEGNPGDPRVMPLGTAAASPMPVADGSQRPSGAAHAPAKEPQEEAPRQDRFPPSRFPARRGPIVPPGYDPVRRQPYRATWPSAPSTTPRSAPSTATSNTIPAVGSDSSPQLPSPADYTRSPP
jgi:hypothetical protein